MSLTPSVKPTNSSENSVFSAALATQPMASVALWFRLMEKVYQSVDWPDLLQTTMLEIQQELAADGVAVYAFTAGGRGQCVAESPLLRFAPELQGINGQWLGLEVSVIANSDLNALQPSQQELLLALGSLNPVIIPIPQLPLLGEVKPLWGMLVVQSDQPRVWQATELEMLRGVGMQLAIALHQVQLRHQVEHFYRDLQAHNSERTLQLQRALNYESLLKRITDKVRDSLDEMQIWQAAVRELTIGLEIGRCNAALYDLEKGTSTICAEYAAAFPAIQGRVQEIGKFPELYEQLFRGEYFQFCSLLPNPTQGRVAMLACPIFDDQGVLGDLWLVHQPDHGYSELEIRLVQQVANQCAIAIRQARLFQASQAQVEELEKLNDLKDEFLSRVSHELRSPVANMKAAIPTLTMALQQAGILSHPNSDQSLGGNGAEIPLNLHSSLRSKVSDYLQILQDQCEREINLVNDLLDLQSLSKDSYGQRETLHINDWIARLVRPFQVRANNRHQSLNYEIQPNLPLLFTDIRAVERIVSELLNNACKYTPPGESILMRVGLRTNNPHFIVVQVENTGIEIAESERAKIFDKFYRVPSADRWKQGGTGLGLALVQKLVEHLGGSIEVESRENKTCFSFYLPTEIHA